MTRFIAALAAALVFSCSALAESPPGKAVRTDVFVAQVAGGNTFEIESSKLALNRSKDKAVRSFADRMVKDHTEAAMKFRSALSEAKLKAPPEGLDAGHKAVLDGLRKKDDVSFDKAYVEAQHKAHVETIALFEDYAKGGDNARMKRFAQEVLPTLRTHLELVSKMH
jgi:putative membrane protein